MAEIIKTRWLEDGNGNKVAPKTLTSQVVTPDGESFEDRILNGIETQLCDVLDAYYEKKELEPITKDSTIDASDIALGEIGYGVDGRLVGTSPLKCIEGMGLAGFPNIRKWHTITYGNGKFVCIVNGSTVAAYSEDGISWTETTLPVNKGWTAACYGHGKFYAFANNTSTYVYSSDGVNWAEGTLPASPYWNMSSYGAGKLVIIGYNSDVFAYTEDGVNWTSGTLPRKGAWCSMTYADGVFLVVPYGEAGGLRSVDGVVWEEITLPAATGWNTVCGIPGRITAICDDTVVGAYTEDKGDTWHTFNMPSQQVWYSSVNGDGRLVCVAESSEVAAYSDDGVVWIESPLGVNGKWGSVTYGEGTFVTCGRDSNKVSYSHDGENWITTNGKYVCEVLAIPAEGLYLQYGDGAAQKVVITDAGLAFENA